MTLNEIKAVIEYAKKSRVKSLTIDGLSFELFERQKREKRIKPTQPNEKTLPNDRLPTLDEINRFIYENPEEEQK